MAAEAPRLLMTCRIRSQAQLGAARLAPLQALRCDANTHMQRRDAEGLNAHKTRDVPRLFPFGTSHRSPCKPRCGGAAVIGCIGPALGPRRTQFAAQIALAPDLSITRAVGDVALDPHH